jgi:hypothetical protein
VRAPARIGYLDWIATVGPVVEGDPPVGVLGGKRLPACVLGVGAAAVAAQPLAAARAPPARGPTRLSCSC